MVDEEELFGSFADCVLADCAEPADKDRARQIRRQFNFEASRVGSSLVAKRDPSKS